MKANDICECGHKADDHHISYSQTSGMYAEECEFYGFNEEGGMKQEEDGTWVEHCMRFKLSEHEGVTLTVNPEDWPNDLYGIKIEEQNVYIENGLIKIFGDPIWKLNGMNDGT